MRFKRIKPKEAKLAGITIEVDMSDTRLNSVTLRDASGGILRVTYESYSSMFLEMPAPPETVTKWKIEGTLSGLRLEEKFFETESKAEHWLDTFKESLGYPAGLDVKVIEVEVEEQA